MNRTGFDNNTAVHMPVPHHPNSFHGGALHGGTLHDSKNDRGSISDSEDGSCGPYPDIGKGDYEIEDDHAALTSQTLNTDGTPKRPMNAFMIFARRRRPQVSAENQAMRTGEISKILSKEWNSMGAPEKQFYQDQARQLKDTFNMKYPDYVYRRRPNNSRRRRRPDATGLRASENQPPIDPKDETYEDMGDSPTEGEELLTPDGIHDPRGGHELGIYNDHRQPSARASSYVYPAHGHSGAVRPDDRLAYDPQVGNDRTSQDPPGNSLHYSYIAPHNQGHVQTQPIPMYSQGSIGANGNWNQQNLRQRSWTSPNEVAERAFTGLPGTRTHRSSTSPTTWQRSSHTSGSVPAGSPPLALSTLSSPFYPVNSPQEAASPPHTQSISPSFSSGHMQSSLLLGREYQVNAHDLPLSSPNQQYSSAPGRDSMMYSTRQATEPRGLPAISNYSHTQSSFATSPGLGGQGYWGRD